MPVFLHVREASYRARCLSQLRSLSTTLSVYEENNSRRFPLSMPADAKRWYPNREATVPAESKLDSVYWANAIGIDLEELSCPIVDDTSTYAYNGYLHAFSVDDVRDKGVTIGFWEGFGKNPRNVSLPRLDCGEIDTPCHFGQQTSTLTDTPAHDVWVHGRGANFLFLDGHAAWRRLGETSGAPTNPAIDPFHEYDRSGRVDRFWLDDSGRAPLFKP